jgi:threonine/homoserine/homoserine lactone efflux protein
MDTAAFLILMTASAVNMALPGPAILLTFTRATCRGLAAGAWVSAGILLSSLALATAALLILAGLMEVSDGALSVLRWVGLGVILWIAMRLLLAPVAAAASEPGQVRTGDFLAGFALGATSPFNLVFLLALLPQFAPDRLSPANASAMIAAVLLGALLILAAVSLLGAAAGQAVLGRTGASVLQRLAGATLAGFALAAAAMPV